MRVRNQRLPVGYREVEYLESTGTQFIKTDFVPNLNISLDIGFSITDSSTANSWTQITGEKTSYHSTSSLQVAFNTGGSFPNHLGLDYSTATDLASESSAVVSRNTLIHIILSPSNWTVNDTLVVAHKSTFSGTGLPLWIFDCNNNNNNERPFKGRIYFYKIYTNDTLSRNFIPCIRTSDSKPGLYDTVNSTFYTNSGTGEFLYGPYHDSYKVSLYPRLPSAYQEVEYIQSSGTQWIDTRVIPTTKMVTEITLTPDPSYLSEHAIFGSSWTAHGYFLMFYQNAVRFHSRDTFLDVSSFNKTSKNVIRTYSKSLTDKILSINGYPYRYTRGSEGSADSSYYICLFRTGDGNYTTKQGHFTLYNFKIWDDGKAVRDFIPCYRKSDSIIGLYDIVNQQFYTNSGTGTFTKGSDVVSVLSTTPKISAVPSGYQEVEYIESSGTQYIDTGLDGGTVNILDANMQFTSTSGSQLNGADYGVYFGIYNNQFTHTVLGSLSPSKSADTNRHHFISTVNVSSATNTLEIDGVSYTATRTGAYHSYPIYIFAISSSNVNSYICRERVYSFKITIDGLLKRNFIPCYRKSDNVIGLWDAVHGKFYTNAGSGTFTKGSDKTTII